MKSTVKKQIKISVENQRRIKAIELRLQRTNLAPYERRYYKQELDILRHSTKILSKGIVDRRNNIKD